MMSSGEQVIKRFNDRGLKFPKMIFSRLITQGSYLYICLVLLWGVAYFWREDAFTLVRLVSYISAWLALPLLFICGFFIFRKKLKLSLFAFFVSVSLVYPHFGVAPLFLPESGVPDSGYKVMTFSKMGRNNKLKKVASVIKEEQPEIFFVQELTQEEAEVLVGMLKKSYQERLFYEYGYGNLTASVYELMKEEGPYKYFSKIKVFAPDLTISTWNVHFQKSFFNTNVQDEMAGQLAAEIKSTEGPIIVGGDFNATVMNSPYKKINKILINTFEKNGVGFGYTFPSPARNLGAITRFLRIDHIFVSSHFNVDEVHVGKNSGGSDHYPVVAHITAKN